MHFTFQIENVHITKRMSYKKVYVETLNKIKFLFIMGISRDISEGGLDLSFELIFLC